MIHYLTAEQETQIESWLSQLTLDEKIKLLSGADTWSTQAIPRLGIPEVIMTDGPHGVRADRASAKRLFGLSTAFPTGIGIAATWDRELVHELGAALAEESRALGCDVLLGPCVNILRAPLGGRNFETYSEDPFWQVRSGSTMCSDCKAKGWALHSSTTLGMIRNMSACASTLWSASVPCGKFTSHLSKKSCGMPNPGR